MDWTKHPNPLAQSEDESIKANSALNDYFLLGDGRSLVNLHQKYTKAAPEQAPTRHLRTLKEWSAKYAWQARIARQEELVKHQEREEWATRQEDLRKREWKIAMAALDKAEQMLNFPLAEFEKTTQKSQSPDGKTVIENVTIVKPARWLFVDAARVLREASRVARLATGQETENTKHSGEVTQIGMTLEEWQQRQAERRKQVAETLAHFDEAEAEGNE